MDIYIYMFAGSMCTNSTGAVLYCIIGSELNPATTNSIHPTTITANLQITIAFQLHVLLDSLLYWCASWNCRVQIPVLRVTVAAELISRFFFVSFISFREGTSSHTTAITHSLSTKWCCATNRKVAGSIPAGVIGIFH